MTCSVPEAGLESSQSRHAILQPDMNQATSDSAPSCNKQQHQQVMLKRQLSLTARLRHCPSLFADGAVSAFQCHCPTHRSVSIARRPWSFSIFAASTWTNTKQARKQFIEPFLGPFFFPIRTGWSSTSICDLRYPEPDLGCKHRRDSTPP